MDEGGVDLIGNRKEKGNLKEGIVQKNRNVERKKGYGYIKN